MSKKQKSELITDHPIGYNVAFPKYSKWGYTMGDTNFVVRPFEGKEPNWFHRLTQRLILGVKWKKYE